MTRKKANPARLLCIVCSEWGIENGLHYRRDVTFQEDQSCMSDKKMGRAMVIISDLVVMLLNNRGFSNHALARNASPAKAQVLIFGL